MPHLPRLAALAVTLDGSGDGLRVLLVRRRNPPDAGLWGFPGGHVEPGETGLAAAARELAEETGITARPRGYIDNIDVIERTADGSLRFHFLLAAVLCEYVSGRPVAGDDALDARWIAADDVLSARLPLSARVPETLAKALALAGLGRTNSG
ncbi:ADP-ribose pyrophosphatase YjhB, NUDIX family [Paracoccus halophilus]|uniref:ADP-ribose pyrophosphatase YjhB, NUDIX family n=1 Tax=Paracoccus halophilus TaxID=376733 RepID=A0A099F0C8_9RHOB|nr:NUDIX hydrolase [Paracoccus halophilus]KGJ03914.1 NUDIX hydrolase [Paracoccus halophilus]SFA56581.1 ADP-ribose pyrophosphatase YjhB, NUDIX family [Paracoccus halophilus]